ncbi:MAG: N-acetylmuramoyl-L-alanine amidase [Lachnospiraceae bacterium]|nr:N-acetylmuramoyl-L-alanine amidase [Lachnospiraceae bacterium]
MQYDKLMKRTAAYCLIFVVTAMSAMLYYCANKIIVVADVAQDEVEQNAEDGDGGEKIPADIIAEDEKNHINIDRSSQNTNYFCIPMPAGVKAEEVVMENHYMDRELWVMIEPKEMNGQETFYEENGVYGNCTDVLTGHYDVEKHRICLRFALTDVYEYHSIFEDNTLYVEFMTPKETYDKVIVIDPAYGMNDMGVTVNGVNAKDVTLEIAKALKAKLDETDIKVYYTRMDDSNPSMGSRVQLASDTKADMLIRIEVGSAESSKMYGTEAVYNSRFFIPGFGSVELADILEREVVTAISGKANGLVEASDTDGVVSNATVPAAAIKVGYLTNAQEFILLQREDYIQRIAEGIYQSIVKSYEEQNR